MEKETKTLTTPESIEADILEKIGKLRAQTGTGAANTETYGEALNRDGDTRNAETDPAKQNENTPDDRQNAVCQLVRLGLPLQAVKTAVEQIGRRDREIGAFKKWMASWGLPPMSFTCVRDRAVDEENYLRLKKKMFMHEERYRNLEHGLVELFDDHGEKPKRISQCKLLHIQTLPERPYTTKEERVAIVEWLRYVYEALERHQLEDVYCATITYRLSRLDGNGKACPYSTNEMQERLPRENEYRTSPPTPHDNPCLRIFCKTGYDTGYDIEEGIWNGVKRMMPAEDGGERA